jgi:hypothetical protein
MGTEIPAPANGTSIKSSKWIMDGITTNPASAMSVITTTSLA